jgi:hypothetical protein
MCKQHLLSATALLAVTAMLVSCNQNEDANNTSGQRTEVKFTSNIVAMNPETKVVDDNWDEGDAIGIYMFEKTTMETVEEVSNVKYENSDESFSDTGKIIYFPDNGDKVCFMSYYPYNKDVTDVYTVDVDDQSSQSDIDFLYSFNKDAVYDKKTEDKKVTLEFDHKLVKIIINVEAGEGLDDSDLDNINVYFSGLNTKVNFNLIEGSFNNYSDKKNITPFSISKKDGYVASYEAIILPIEEIPTSGAIVFDLDNGDTEEGINSDVFTWNFNSTLVSGTKYTYNATINRSGIVVEATINPWIEEEEEISAE